jgi:hypothetical protein
LHEDGEGILQEARKGLRRGGKKEVNVSKTQSDKVIIALRIILGLQLLLHALSLPMMARLHSCITVYDHRRMIDASQSCYRLSEASAGHRRVEVAGKGRYGQQRAGRSGNKK